MTYFHESNTFFKNHVYQGIFNFATLPTLLFCSRDKKISDYNIQDIAANALIGFFIVLPLSKITFSIALYSTVLALIGHGCVAFCALIADTFQGLNHAYSNL
jgi:hypothetical protein